MGNKRGSGSADAVAKILAHLEAVAGDAFGDFVGTFTGLKHTREGWALSVEITEPQELESTVMLELPATLNDIDDALLDEIVEQVGAGLSELVDQDDGDWINRKWCDAEDAGILETMPLGDLLATFARDEPDFEGVVAIAEARDDAPAEVFAAVERGDLDDGRDALIVVAIERAHARGEPIPAGVARALSLRTVVVLGDREYGVVVRIMDALAAVPAEAVATLRDELAAMPERDEPAIAEHGRALAWCAVRFDEAAYRKLLGYAISDGRVWQNMPIALAATEAVPVLEALWRAGTLSKHAVANAITEAERRDGALSPDLQALRAELA